MPFVKITSVKPAGAARVKIEFEDGSSLRCTDKTALEFGARFGLEFDEKEYELLRLAAETDDCKRAALNFVSYKKRTIKQIKTKLRSRGFSDAAINRTIKFLLEYNYADDEKFAEEFVSSYLIRNPSGSARIESEMLKRGFPKKIIRSKIDDLNRSESIEELASAAAEKQWRALSGKPPEDRKRLLFARLYRRGFDFETIKKATKKYFE